MITKDPEVDDQTPTISNAPASSELNVAEITQTTQKNTGRKRRSVFNNVVDKLESKLFERLQTTFLKPLSVFSTTLYISLVFVLNVIS